MKRLSSLITLLLLSFTTHAQITPELYSQLPDTLKPKNILKPELKELCAIIDNTALSLHDFSNEMESLAGKINSQLPYLKNRDEKIAASYTLMVFYYNFAGDDNIKSEYSELLLNAIGKDKRGYEKQYFNCLLIKANGKSGEYNFEEAINLIKNALTQKAKIKNKNIVAGAYLTLSDIYKKIYLFDESLLNLDLATQTADKTSDYYNKYLKNYAFLKKSELNILKYLHSKEDKYLKSAKKLLNDKAGYDLKDRWLALWYLQNSYITFLENNYTLSKLQFDTASNIPFDEKINGAIACRFETLKGLLLIKNNQEAEGVKILEEFYAESPNEFYYEISLKELYNYFKAKKDYAKTNLYLEKILETKTLQDNYKYKGAVFTANKKYDVREKQIEIERLEAQVIIKRNEYYLIIFGILFILLSVISILIFKNRQRKIKQLKKEQEYFENIKLMEEYLQNEEAKMRTEREALIQEQRSEIGQNLHNDVLGSIVALNYLIEDYKANSIEEHEKNGFYEIGLEVNSIYMELRNFSHALTKPENISYLFDVVAYLENIKNKFSEIGLLNIESTADKEKINAELPPQIKTELYYLIKECVSNTLKHANASTLKINITLEDSVCYVQIVDNGKGMTNQKYNKGIGLAAIKERIAKINGQVSIDSNKSGTAITAQIFYRI